MVNVLGLRRFVESCAAPARLHDSTPEPPLPLAVIPYVRYVCYVRLCAIKRQVQKAVAALNLCGYNEGVESNSKPLPAPRGLSVQQVARMLGYSEMTVRRMIRSGELVAWRPRGCHGRRWLIDEVSLATLQAALVQQARRRCRPVQDSILQGELRLEW